MPGPTLAPENVGQAILEKGAAVPGVPPEHRRAAEGYRNHVKERGHRSAQEAAAARKLAADRKAAQKTIDENIGKDRVEVDASGVPKLDASGNPIPTEAGKRFDEASTFEGAISDFIKGGKGWEGLTASQKDLLRTGAINEIKSWVNAPGGADYFTGKDANAIVDQFLAGDLDVFDKVKGLYEAQLVNPAAEGLPGSIVEKQKALADKAKEIHKTSVDRAKVKQKLKTAETEYEELWADERTDPSNTTGPKIPGSELGKLQGYEKLKAQLDQDPNYVSDREAEIGRINEGIKTFNETYLSLANAKKNVNQNALDQAQDRLDNAITARANISKELTDYGTLEDNINKLNQAKAGKQTNIDSLKQQGDDHTVKLKELGEQYQEARVQKLAVEGSRAEQEQAFVDSIKNILPDAVNEVFTARAKLMEEGYQKMLDEIETDPDADPHRKALADAMRLRYDKFKDDHGLMHSGLRRADTTRVADKDAIEKDRDGLKKDFSKEGDPEVARKRAAENVMRRSLQKATNPDTGKAYTPDEINNLITSPDFVENNIGDVTAGLIAKGLRTGQIRVKDMDKFVQNGFITEEKMVEAFVEHNKKAQEAMKNAGISKDGLVKSLKDKKWWILLLLLSPGLFAIAGAGVATYKIAKEVKGSGGHDKKPPAPSSPPAESASESGEGEGGEG